MKIIQRNYGSIPHLSTSKLTQQADKKISLGQEEILTKKARDYKDLIIVTEKIDGSNVGIVRKDGNIVAITRSGYDAYTSPYRQHHLFGDYVKKNIYKFEWLPEGVRVCGEWCAVSHGTIYDITGEEPFIAFDIIEGKTRLTYLEFIKLCAIHNIETAPLLHIGSPISIKSAIKELGTGHYGGTNKPEGVVYRVERDGSVDFLAKWVRADKEDGKYLDTELFNVGYVSE